MGFNTVVTLLNDRSNEWPNEIKCAESRWKPRHLRHGFHESGNFGYGSVISRSHADCPQVTVVGQNSGRLLAPVDPIENPTDLDALAEVLRGHGYSVKAPGDNRAKPPLNWGYAAREENK